MTQPTEDAPEPQDEDLTCICLEDIPQEMIKWREAYNESKVTYD